ncbi:hypothetical protein [Devosia sp. SD17-2]|uniref:hypothetical protein n=1 Tax=Devosia sp. SD17-2 TaxID=2976459 RepID=UPI0023D7DC30|nr:hypothetical protein [Devosia sp. SD17-2]WEJ31692.1 hypothetical protein NYQ88_12335 [Devosia sp. SD17-2]
MPRTISEIRKANRERKRIQRAAMAEAGVPTSAQVHNAIGEALAFAASSGVNIEATRRGEQPLIAVTSVLSAAHKILVHRLGLDAAACTAALLKVLAPRPEHRWPSYVPSHYCSPMPKPSHGDAADGP